LTKHVCSANRQQRWENVKHFNFHLKFQRGTNAMMETDYVASDTRH